MSLNVKRCLFIFFLEKISGHKCPSESVRNNKNLPRLFAVDGYALSCGILSGGSLVQCTFVCASVGFFLVAVTTSTIQPPTNVRQMPNTHTRLLSLLVFFASLTFSYLCEMLDVHARNLHQKTNIIGMDIQTNNKMPKGHRESICHKIHHVKWQ